MQLLYSVLHFKLRRNEIFLKTYTLSSMHLYFRRTCGIFIFEDGEYAEAAPLNEHQRFKTLGKNYFTICSSMSSWIPCSIYCQRSALY